MDSHYIVKEEKKSRQKPMKQAPRIISEVRYKNLMPPLKLFELVIIAKFLPASTKLCTLALLNRQWNKFTKQNFAWHSLPSLPLSCSSSIYISFLHSLTDLNGLVLNELPPFILEHRALAPMAKCHSFSVLFQDIRLVSEFVNQNKKFLQKMQGILVRQVQRPSQDLQIQKEINDFKNKIMIIRRNKPRPCNQAIVNLRTAPSLLQLHLHFNPKMRWEIFAEFPTTLRSLQISECLLNSIPNLHSFPSLQHLVLKCIFRDANLTEISNLPLLRSCFVNSILNLLIIEGLPSLLSLYVNGQALSLTHGLTSSITYIQENHYFEGVGALFPTANGLSFTRSLIVGEMALDFFTPSQTLLSLTLDHVTLFPPNRLFSRIEQFFPHLQDISVSGLSANFSELQHSCLRKLYISTEWPSVDKLRLKKCPSLQEITYHCPYWNLDHLFATSQLCCDIPREYSYSKKLKIYIGRLRFHIGLSNNCILRIEGNTADGFDIQTLFSGLGESQPLTSSCLEGIKEEESKEEET